ncbi:MAG: hypothetical protein WBS54_08540 [Acidobacteriota bacterium]
MGGTGAPFGRHPVGVIEGLLAQDPAALEPHGVCHHEILSKLIFEAALRMTCLMDRRGARLSGSSIGRNKLRPLQRPAFDPSICNLQSSICNLPPAATKAKPTLTVIPATEGSPESFLSSEPQTDPGRASLARMTAQRSRARSPGRRPQQVAAATKARIRSFNLQSGIFNLQSSSGRCKGPHSILQSAIWNLQSAIILGRYKGQHSPLYS